MERLSDAPSPERRRELVMEFLIWHAGRATRVPDVVRGAVALLARPGAALPVARLAEELGCGRQHLHREVARHLGLPPRTLARLGRFAAELSAVRAGPATAAGSTAGRAAGGWASLAAEFGYYDQPHLYREFRELAGMTPEQVRRAWLAESGQLPEQTRHPSTTDPHRRP